MCATEYTSSSRLGTCLGVDVDRSFRLDYAGVGSNLHVCTGGSCLRVCSIGLLDSGDVMPCLFAGLFVCERGRRRGFEIPASHPYSQKRCVCSCSSCIDMFTAKEPHLGLGASARPNSVGIFRCWL